MWWLVRQTDTAYRRATLELCLPHSGESVLDCGCGNGSETLKVAQRIGASKKFGTELDPVTSRQAREKGVGVTGCDLNAPLPFKSSSLDVVFTQQVFEHLPKFDVFLSELYRVIKPGGYLVLSTVNLASWPNILSLLLGWQPLTYTQLTPLKPTVGNPLAFRDPSEAGSAYHCHIVPITLPALKDLLTIHGFKVEEVSCAGYNPLPPPLATWLSRWDPNHASSLNVRARKPV